MPIIDITHPDFAIAIDPSELQAAVEKAVADVEGRLHGSPEEQQQQQLQLHQLLAGSFLAPKIAAARGKVLNGMSTYFLKLGPNNLGAGYSRDIDRAIAGSLPCLSNRLRLQDMARLMTDALLPILAARTNSHPGHPLHLLNIAGGPGMD